MTESFLATGHIALWLLIAGLFFPRLALLFAWLGTGTYPPNTLPLLLNFASWLLFPRFLMAYYVTPIWARTTSGFGLTSSLELPDSLGRQGLRVAGLSAGLP